jgi:hypothetical protein
MSLSSLLGRSAAANKGLGYYLVDRVDVHQVG